MKLINKTDTTLIFNDINLVLMLDKDKKGIEVEDFDIKNSPSLRHYIDRGFVEIINPDENNIVYRAIKNKPEVIERQSKKIAKVNNQDKSENTNSDEIILGGQSKTLTSRVYKVPKTSSIDKFRETGQMDIAYNGPCFASDTIAITSDGVKFFEDVEVGDLTLSHVGKWRKITEKYVTQYNSRLLEIKPCFSNAISIGCTPNHKFYSNNDNIKGWKKASELSNEDFLFVPKIEFLDGKEFILLSDYIDVDFNEQQNGFCSVVPMTEDFMKIISYYINYGYYIEKESKVFFKIEKKSFFEFISLMRNIFGIKSVEYTECEKYFLYSCKSISLLRFFKFFCGDEFKKIPLFLFRKNISRKFLKFIIKEKLVNKKGTIVIYSKHPLVIWGLRLMLLEVSVISTIQHFASRFSYCLSFSLKQYESKLKEAGILEQNFKWKDNTTKNRPVTYKLLDDGIFITINEKSQGKLVDKVYNFEVEGENSYTANFCAVHNCYDAGGYAKMNRNYMFGLNEKKDVNIKLDIPENMSLRIQIDDDLVKKLNNLRENSIGEDCVKIYGSTATTILWGGYKILYTMMETEKVHPQYIEKCSMANEVWLPTDWCIEKFRECGLKTPIYKMPIGVDLENYVEGKQPITFGWKEKGFIFLSVFGWSLRKGYDILLQAYYEEFNSQDDVTLVLCSKFAGKTDSTSKDVIKNEIKRIEQSVKKTNKPRPPLLVSDSIPEKMMGNLYNSAHAYICISRGEGFGLPLVEASMCGLPVISSNYSGPKDFLNYDNSFLVEPEGVRVNPGAEWVSYYYSDMPMAHFDRKSIDQTRAHMRYVYENYALAKEKNRKLQNFIRENYGWNICVNRAYERLKDIYSHVKHRGEK